MKTKEVTIIKDWGPFSPGDVIEADPMRAEQLVEQKIGIMGRQTVNNVDVAKTRRKKK